MSISARSEKHPYAYLGVVRGGAAELISGRYDEKRSLELRREPGTDLEGSLSESLPLGWLGPRSFGGDVICELERLNRVPAVGGDMMLDDEYRLRRLYIEGKLGLGSRYSGGVVGSLW